MTGKHRKAKSAKHEDNFFKHDVPESEVRDAGSNTSFTVQFVLLLMMVVGGATVSWFCVQQHQTVGHLTDIYTGMQMKIEHSSDGVQKRFDALEDSFAMAQKQAGVAMATAEQLKASDLPAQALSLHIEMKARLAEVQQAAASAEQLGLLHGALQGKSEELEVVRLQVEELGALSAQLAQRVEALAGGLGQADAALDGQATELRGLKAQLGAHGSQLEASSLEVSAVREMLEAEHSSRVLEPEGEAPVEPEEVVAAAAPPLPEEVVPTAAEEPVVEEPVVEEPEQEDGDEAQPEEEQEAPTAAPVEQEVVEMEEVAEEEEVHEESSPEPQEVEVEEAREEEEETAEEEQEVAEEEEEEEAAAAAASEGDAVEEEGIAEDNEYLPRAFLTPVRDEEAESQRKARSRQARQTRRSTQEGNVQSRLGTHAESPEHSLTSASALCVPPDISIVNRTSCRASERWTRDENQNPINGEDRLPVDTEQQDELDNSMEHTAASHTQNSNNPEQPHHKVRKSDRDKRLEYKRGDLDDFSPSVLSQSSPEQSVWPAANQSCQRVLDSGGLGESTTEKPLGRMGSYTRRETRLASLSKQEEGSGTGDYKKMYETALHENDKLKSRLRDSKQELAKIRSQLDKAAPLLARVQALRRGNQWLLAENRAMLRVLSRLSDPTAAHLPETEDL
ncbi:hypothetical protein NHX12_012702 [Muraenolepis orangiensis]|uniref:Uncharacterized protein n=1 Tax=Muraenolepis orangiensis TaxID=630683 RepID=A0A9Q0I492_9TELE|nr:hypothetical protein NHX12_012702 [Muraenolepis orangiensis]